ALRGQRWCSGAQEHRFTAATMRRGSGRSPSGKPAVASYDGVGERLPRVHAFYAEKRPFPFADRFPARLREMRFLHANHAPAIAIRARIEPPPEATGQRP